VLDLRGEAGDIPSRWPKGITVESCGLPEYEAPSAETLDWISRRTAGLLETGATVFVHCREGIQRAPMVACAVLMHTGWSLGDAYRLVTTRRPVTAMSEAQLRVLREVEQGRGAPSEVRAGNMGNDGGLYRPTRS
jgi:protein-tyrosine phosphatase